MSSTDRLIAVIEAAVEAKTPARAGWHDGVSDALTDLDRALQAADDNRAADAAVFIRTALSGLAGIWHDADERDAIVLAAEPEPAHADPLIAAAMRAMERAVKSPTVRTQAAELVVAEMRARRNDQGVDFVRLVAFGRAEHDNRSGGAMEFRSWVVNAVELERGGGRLYQVKDGLRHPALFDAVYDVAVKMLKEEGHDY